MRRTCTGLLLLGALVLPAQAMAAANPQLSNTRLKSNFTELRSLIKLAPPSRSGKRLESRLLNFASQASSRISKGDPCGARTPLASLRASARTTPQLKLAERSDLMAASLNAEMILLSRASARKCGGATRPPAAQPGVTVLSSTPTMLKLRFNLPTPNFVGEVGANDANVALQMEGMQATGAGTPAVPGFFRWFAVPQGAKVSVKTTQQSSFMLPAVDLAPAQPEPVDQDPPPGPDVTSEDPEFKRPPFVRSRGDFAKRTPYPPKAISIGAGGPSRNLNLGRVNVAGAQSVPGKRQLKVNTAFEVEISFTGGTGKFATSELVHAENKTWQSIYSASVLNFATAAKFLENVTLQPCGEDVLIITTPALREQADRLAVQKRARGYTTTVFETGTAQVGSTADQIKAFVKTRFNNGNCSKKIDYLILFGKSIPMFVKPAERNSDTIPSDYDYSLMFDGWWIPSFAVGRIPADTLASATNIVNKIIAYENSPPADPTYYQKAAIAGEFQWDDGCGADCNVQREARTFITASEWVRNAAVARGKVVDRLYKKQPGATPKKFEDGTALPSAILEPAFSWNATNADIASKINDGRFLVFHRDHGGINGWSTPAFNTSDISALTNSELPIVWSINCATGRYDGAAFSFAEQFVRKSGAGAAAVVAASRNSPSRANSYLARALAHTAFANAIPGFPQTAPVLEVGDALNLAKLYLAFTYTPSVGGDGAAAVVHDEMRMYNVFGDPTLQLRVNAP